MQGRENFIDYLFIKRRWVFHVGFWLMILSFYVMFFGRKTENYFMTFFFVGLLMPVTIGTTYFLNYVLIPRYLMQERYFIFTLYSIYTLLASVFLETSISLITLIVIAKAQIKNMDPASIDIVFLVTSLSMVVCLGVAIKMATHWRRSKEAYQSLMLEKVETELKFLKAQLNPHFLFNTLNNLYYLATVKSEKAPQAILSLSEMLEYLLHDGKSTFVSLEKELKHVQHYIALELLRYEGRVHLDLKISGDTQSHTIGPMILITLIENSFKHGVMPLAGKSWIKVRVDCTMEMLKIEIANSAKEKNNGHGIGLENLRGQLKHLYRDAFELLVENSGDSFTVNLTIKKQQ
jgi:two-component system LytT family sensor kinase